MKMSQSPWVLHYDGSSCNGCDIEVLASTTPRYDLERFGIINTGDPKHADVFLITGGINYQNRSVVQQLYSQMPDPKGVVAIGICACDGGVFKECYNILGGVDKVIPVDVYVPGCAARPESIIDGVVKALGILEQKRERMKQGLPPEEKSFEAIDIDESIKEELKAQLEIKQEGRVLDSAEERQPHIAAPKTEADQQAEPCENTGEPETEKAEGAAEEQKQATTEEDKTNG